MMDDFTLVLSSTFFYDIHTTFGIQNINPKSRTRTIYVDEEVFFLEIHIAVVVVMVVIGICHRQIVDSKLLIKCHLLKNY